MPKKYIRKLNRSGGYSYAVNLPSIWVDDLGWRRKQKLTLTKVGKRIIIEDWKKK